MPTRTLFEYIAAFALGIIVLFPYFLFGGVVSSRLEIWVRLVVYAALLFSPVSRVGRPRFQLVLVFCFPVVAITLMLGFAESHNFLDGLPAIAEPILCVLLGASLACIALRLGRVHR